MRTLILISDIGSQKRDYERFGIQLLKKKFNVLYLDCTKWLQPNFYKNKTEKDFSFKEKIVTKNFKQLESIIKKNKKIVGIIDLLGVSEKHQKIRSFIKKNKIKLIFILNIELKTKLKFYQKVLFYIYKKNKLDALSRKLFKSPIENYDISKADVLLLNGEKGKELINNNHQSINLCHFDYQNYLNEKKKTKKNINGNYALFLDQYLPNHSGQNYIGNLSKNLDQAKYYQNLEFFFNKFEKMYGLEIVVAAHPRSNYEKNKFLSNKRKFFINKTPELIKYSKIVFTHTSNSLNYGILFNKPIFFLTFSLYKHQDVFRPEFLSDYFKTFCFKIDNTFFPFPEKKILFKVNNQAYNNYKKNYLVTKNYKNHFFWDEFSKKIIKLK